MKIEIRKLKPEEKVHSKLMASICFMRTIPPEDRYPWLEKPEEHTKDYDICWGAFDENGRLLSSMMIIPATIRVNGHRVKAGLISGVMTLPEARNSRCVRQIFDVTMEEMKKDGVVYSLLYPFSFPFYRKFGYERAYSRPRATFPISGLSRFPFPDGMKVHDKGGPWADFAKVYEVFAEGKNLAVVRGEKEWTRMLDRDPHKKREFTYIHYNKTGQPDGYVLYKPVVKDASNVTMNITELVWADKPGLEAMLGFIHGMRSEYTQVSCPFPELFDAYGLVEDHWTMSVSPDAHIMNRVVDVLKALEQMDIPPGKGEFVIGVTDKFLHSNTGAYGIAWEGGALRVETSHQPPDFEVDVETLVQLTTGYLTPAQVIYRDNVAIHGKMEELTAFFPKKDLFMMEAF